MSPRWNHRTTRAPLEASSVRTPTRTSHASVLRNRIERSTYCRYAAATRMGSNEYSSAAGFSAPIAKMQSADHAAVRHPPSGSVVLRRKKSKNHGLRA